LTANDLGRITLRTAEPLALDDYADVRHTGAFLLVDPADGSTLTAGMADLSAQDAPNVRTLRTTLRPSSARPQVPSDRRGLGASTRPVCGRRLPAR
jgi:sulfate adenylyltransferase subunit 1 (EFTu-like GTPase family)